MTDWSVFMPGMTSCLRLARVHSKKNIEHSLDSEKWGFVRRLFQHLPQLGPAVKN